MKKSFFVTVLCAAVFVAVGFFVATHVLPIAEWTLLTRSQTEASQPATPVPMPAPSTATHLNPNLNPSPTPAPVPTPTATPTPTPEPTPTPTPAPFRHVDIPILMYHTSSEHNPGPLAELYVRPSEFEAQMVWLIDNGFTFVTFDDWDYLHTIERPIMITFDDGYPANYYEILPILKEHDVTIVLFLTLMAIRAHGFTEEMIVAMHESGHVVFESHTMTHTDMRTQNESQLRFELAESRTRIEALTGRVPIALAYPAGRFNDEVKRLTSEYYRFGLRHDLGMHNTEYDDFEIRRIRISRSTNMSTFQSLVAPRS